MMVFAFSTMIGAQTTGDVIKTKNVLVIQSDSNDILTTVPTEPGTVMKFRNDSVVLTNGKWSTGLNSFGIGEFKYIEMPTSNITLKVIMSTESMEIPGKDMQVTLQNGDKIADGSINEYVKTCDSEGNIIFENVPVGFYNFHVTDPSNIFGSKTERIAHIFNESTTISLEENVLPPINLTYFFERSENGLYDVWISWMLDPEERPIDYIMDYAFNIYIGDQLHGTTQQYQYLIEGMEKGTYDIFLTSISRYGNQYSEKMEIALDGAKVELPVDDSDQIRYYDIKGLSVMEENLTPGIYIKKYSSGRVEKILIR